MRLSTILPTTALLASALASTPPHAVADLLARAIDPATMDPTRLSVLSVLKTAMPTATGTDIVLPTGTAMPQWYKDLPADVMVLLAQMYPATSTASSVREPVAPSMNATENVKETASVSASQTTLTSTLELVPTDTASSNASISASSSNQVFAKATATLSSGAPSATQSVISTGAKNFVGVEKWSIAMGFGVAAVFCFFA